MVRSLGLRRLNQVVERPDTPQIRGLVARIPHLVQIVDESPRPAWAIVPEYTVRSLEAASVPAVPPAPAEAIQVGQESTVASEVEELVVEPALKIAEGKPPRKSPAPAKAVSARKAARAVAAKRSKAARGEETKKSKGAASKVSKPAKKGKK